jgi:hypothetical protein
MSKPSWHDFYDVHEAAEFFHSFSDQDQLDELADDIADQKVIFEPIHTASMPLERRPFVIDGVSRLDAAEARGFQVIDKAGHWTGMLGSPPGARPMVVHHPCLKNEQIWSIVTSLNNKRRHLTTGQRAAIADRMATGTRGGDRKTNQTKAIKFDQPTVEQAAEMMRVSPLSVHQVRKVRREAPNKMKEIKAGKLAPSKAVSEIERRKAKHGVQRTLEDETWAAWSRLLKKFPQTQHRQVIGYVLEFIKDRTPMKV